MGDTKEDMDELAQVDFGEPVFDRDGNKLGTVRGFSQDGIIVTMREGIEGMSLAHIRSGQEFGEAELMWRCMECGEMGEIDDELPEVCPNCGAPKENLMYWTED